MIKFYRKIFIMLALLIITLTVLGQVSATNNESIDNEVKTIQQDTDNIQENTSSINKKDTKKETVKTGNNNDPEELDDETEGTGCSSVLIQGYNNDSSLSFRRDATNKLTINVKHDNSIVKQYKDGSYFFHVIISKNGWMVGNGGADNAQVNKQIENNALTMINKNMITYENMNNIYNQESRLSLGHFVIKAPNGTYSLIIKNGGRTFKDSGVLKERQYLIVPNNIYYYKKNTVTDIKTENSMIQTSRLLTARDGFGVNRREIVTYYYKNNRVNSTVKITATNDNGKYVGRRTAGLIDNFQTNNRHFSSSSIPVIDSYVNLDTVNFFIRKTKTSIKTENIKSNTGKVELKARITDEFGRNVNTGKVSVVIDGNSLKYPNGNVIYIPVKNGQVKYNTTPKNLWNKKNHTYCMKYESNDFYMDSKSNNARINIDNFFTIKTSHYSNIFYGSRLAIKTRVSYDENYTWVTGGRVFYKINGKTVLNSKNKTLFKAVKGGKAVYNYTFNSKYKARTYVLTTVYVNGAYRREYKTSITIKKIPVRIISQNISLNRNVVHFTGKLVDKYDRLVKYDSNLTVKINGKIIKNNNTIRKFNIKRGIINFKFTVPKKYMKKGNILTIIIPEYKQTLAYNRNYTVKV